MNEVNLKKDYVSKFQIFSEAKGLLIYYYNEFIFFSGTIYVKINFCEKKKSILDFQKAGYTSHHGYILRSTDKTIVLGEKNLK